MRQYGTRGWLALSALFVLALAVIFLSYTALSRSHPPVAAAGQTPGYDPSSSSLTEPEEPTEGGEEPEEQEDPDFAVPALSRVLAASDGETAYRSVTGTCPEASAVVEMTTDGGANWGSSDLNAFSGASALQRFSPSRDGVVTAIARSSADCTTPVVLTSYSYGSDWMEETSEAVWWTDTEDSSLLHGPGNQPVSAPCPVARLSVSDAAVAALCVDGSIALTLDEGTTWRQTSARLGAQDISVYGQTLYLAQAGTASCSGTLVESLAPDLETVSESCLETVLAPANTAIAASEGGALWLWAGDQILRSTDGGLDWQ